MAGPDLSVFGKLRSFNDYQRMQEEFEMQKAAQEQAAQVNALQLQKAQKDLNATDIKSLAEQSLFAYNQGQPMTPEGRAALETLAVLEGSKTSFQPDEFGNVRAVTQANPYQQFLGGTGAAMPAPIPMGGDPMAAHAAARKAQMGAIGASPVQGDLDVQPMDLAGIEQMMGASSALNMPVRLTKPENFGPSRPAESFGPQLDKEVAASPFGRKAIFEKQLKLMEDMNNPATEIGKMQLDEKRGLVPPGSTEALIKEKTRQTRKEDIALEKEEKAAKEALEQEKATKNIAETKVREALKTLEKSVFASGLGASAALMAPGKSTPADVLASAYSTLKSNISLDKMMQLKNASPTGSTGFGALSEKELKVLTDQIAELDPELPYEVQKQNLANIARVLKLNIPELTGNAGGNANIQSLIDKYAD